MTQVIEEGRANDATHMLPVGVTPRLRGGGENTTMAAIRRDSVPHEGDSRNASTSGNEKESKGAPTKKGGEENQTTEGQGPKQVKRRRTKQESEVAPENRTVGGHDANSRKKTFLNKNRNHSKLQFKGVINGERTFQHEETVGEVLHRLITNRKLEGNIVMQAEDGWEGGARLFGSADKARRVAVVDGMRTLTVFIRRGQQLMNARGQKVHIQNATVTAAIDKPEDITCRWEGHTQEHRELVWKI